jgi:hypothetical protein
VNAPAAGFQRAWLMTPPEPEPGQEFPPGVR